MKERLQETHWLNVRYGIDPNTLDEETRALVEELGESGVAELVESSIFVSQSDSDVLEIEQITRLIDTQDVGILDQARIDTLAALRERMQDLLINRGEE